MVIPTPEQKAFAEQVVADLARINQEKEQINARMEQLKVRVKPVKSFADSTGNALSTAWKEGVEAYKHIEATNQRAIIARDAWIRGEGSPIDENDFDEQNRQLISAVASANVQLDVLRSCEKAFEYHVHQARKADADVMFDEVDHRYQAQLLKQEREQQFQQMLREQQPRPTSAALPPVITPLASPASSPIRLKPIAATATVPLIQELQTLKAAFDKKYPGKHALKPGDDPNSPSSYRFEFSAPAGTTPGQEKAAARSEAEKFLADQAKAKPPATFLLEEFTVNATGGETPSGTYYFSCGNGEVYKGTKDEIHKQLTALADPAITPSSSPTERAKIVSGLARFRSELNIPIPQAAAIQTAKTNVAGGRGGGAAAAAAAYNDPDPSLHSPDTTSGHGGLDDPDPHSFV
jgi:hypothetical protein